MGKLHDHTSWEPSPGAGDASAVVSPAVACGSPRSRLRVAPLFLRGLACLAFFGFSFSLRFLRGSNALTICGAGLSRRSSGRSCRWPGKLQWLLLLTAAKVRNLGEIRRHAWHLGADLYFGLSNFQVEQFVDGIFTDGLHHRLEHGVALTLVFNQWVTLCHRSQTDAFTQVIHFVEVLLPLLANGFQKNTPFKFT